MRIAGIIRLRQAVCLLLLVAALVVALAGCSDSDTRKAAKAAHDISVGLQAVGATVDALYKDGGIDKAEAKALAGYVVDATLANDQFIAQVKAAKAAGGADRGNIGKWFGAVNQSLAALNQQGVLHVKNPEAQRKLQLTMASVDAAVGIVTAMLAGK